MGSPDDNVGVKRKWRMSRFDGHINLGRKDKVSHTAALKRRLPQSPLLTGAGASFFGSTGKKPRTGEPRPNDGGHGRTAPAMSTPLAGHP